MSKIMELADAYSEQYDDAYGKDGDWREARAALQAEVERIQAELQAEASRWHDEYLSAANLVANMHMAATGEIGAPKQGVVEDVLNLRLERDALRENLASVEKDAERYRWLRERDDWVLIQGMRSEVCLRSNLDDQIDMSMGAFIGESK